MCALVGGTAAVQSTAPETMEKDNLAYDLCLAHSNDQESSWQTPAPLLFSRTHKHNRNGLLLGKERWMFVKGT